MGVKTFSNVCSFIFLWKLIVTHLFRKSPHFTGIRRFISVFARFGHWFLS